MEEIIRFAVLAKSGRFTVKQLCADFGISRKTGYKYIRRYGEEGLEGLRQHSRRPHRCPHRTGAGVEQAILKERRLHRTWGPKKIRRRLTTKYGIESPPAHSTIGLILSRHGLSKPRPRLPGLYRCRPSELTEPTHVNEVWSADFKGWFFLGGRQRGQFLIIDFCDLQPSLLADAKAIKVRI